MAAMRVPSTLGRGGQESPQPSPSLGVRAPTRSPSKRTRKMQQQAAGDTAAAAILGVRGGSRHGGRSSPDGPPRSADRAPGRMSASSGTTGGPAATAGHSPKNAAHASIDARKAVFRNYINPVATKLATVDNHAQTDASIVPSCTSLQDHLTEMYTKHWVTLRALRESVSGTLTCLSGTLYDFIAFKNVAGGLPGFSYAGGSPLVDLVLLTGKFQRSMSLLVRQMSALFNVVFADGVADDMFHFTEMDLARRKLAEVAGELESATSEIENLQSRVQTLETRDTQQRELIEKMEVKNSGLEVKSASLEDQMALLFEQLADDYIYYNENELRHTLEDSKLHEKMAPARSAFGQAIEAVQQRLRYFQDVLSDINVDATSHIKDAVDEYKGRGGESSGFTGSAGVEKSKLKSLEIHFHHLASRFHNVREGLQTTAKELQVALADKKKVLNLSVHHLKAYELQNNKLRTVRAKLTDARRAYAALQSEYRKAFPTATLLTVDENGKITHYVKRPDGKDEVTMPGMAIKDIEKMMHGLNEEIQTLTEVVTTTDEHKHLMRTVALSIPSGHRHQDADGQRKSAKETRKQTEEVHNALAIAEVEAAKPPPVAAPKESGAGGEHSGDPTSSGGGKPRGPNEVATLKTDYTNKLTFIREVYEDRIRTLESKVDVLVKKLQAANPDAAPSESDLSAASQAKKKWLAKKAALLDDGEVEKRGSLLRSLRDLDDYETNSGGSGDEEGVEYDGDGDGDDDPPQAPSRRPRRSLASNVHSVSAASGDAHDADDAPPTASVSQQSQSAAESAGRVGSGHVLHAQAATPDADGDVGAGAATVTSTPINPEPVLEPPTPGHNAQPSPPPPGAQPSTTTSTPASSAQLQPQPPRQPSLADSMDSQQQQQGKHPRAARGSQQQRAGGGPRHSSAGTREKEKDKEKTTPPPGPGGRAGQRVSDVSDGSAKQRAKEKAEAVKDFHPGPD